MRIKFKEKNLLHIITKELQRANIPNFKISGTVYQKSGLADLWIFYNYKTYALELKTDFAVSHVSKLQIWQANDFYNDVIWLYADRHNYVWILDQIKANNHALLKHYSRKQISFLKEKHEQTPFLLPKTSTRSSK